MSDTDRPRLTPAQVETARAMPWYAEWLRSTGRTEDEVRGLEPLYQVDSTIPSPLH